MQKAEEIENNIPNTSGLVKKTQSYLKLVKEQLQQNKTTKEWN